MMMLQSKYTEKRVVCANKKQIWELLTNCSYLSEWMPFVSNIEHLSNNSLNAGSILWIETLIKNQKNVFLFTVSDYENERLISFDSIQEGNHIKYSYNIVHKDKRLCEIIMTTELRIKFWKILFKKQIFQDALSYGWMQLDGLDRAITKYRVQLYSL